MISLLHGSSRALARARDKLRDAVDRVERRRRGLRIGDLDRVLPLEKSFQRHHRERIDDATRDERRVGGDLAGVPVLEVLLRDVFEDDSLQVVHTQSSINVDTSPTGSPNSCARRIRRTILPLRVLGSVSTNAIDCGIASGDSRRRTVFMISNSRSGPASNPRFSTTNAFTTSMLTASGVATAADSATAGCSRSADSISNGPTRCPPVLM